MGEDARLDDFVTEKRVEDEASTTDDGTANGGAVDDAADDDTADDDAANDDAADDAGKEVGETPESSNSAESTTESTSDDVGSAAGADGLPPNPDGSTAATGAAATISEGPPDAVERTTYWRPEECSCERCGSTALRLWNEAGTLVCSDCAPWQR